MIKVDISACKEYGIALDLENLTVEFIDFPDLDLWFKKTEKLYKSEKWKYEAGIEFEKKIPELEQMYNRLPRPDLVLAYLKGLREETASITVCEGVGIEYLREHINGETEVPHSDVIQSMIRCGLVVVTDTTLMIDSRGLDLLKLKGVK